jgi:hypothetical protein
MMNGDSTNKIPKGHFTRKKERRLVGMVMLFLAYLIEKAALRSTKRSGIKSSALNISAS